MLPSLFSIDLPYFDIMDYNKKFDEIISKIDKIYTNPIFIYYKQLCDIKSNASTADDFLKLYEQFLEIEDFYDAKHIANICKCEYNHLLREEEKRKKKRVEEHLQYLEEVKKEQIFEQRMKWKEKGLCLYCGGKLNFITKRCKSCNEFN